MPVKSDFEDNRQERRSRKLVSEYEQLLKEQGQCFLDVDSYIAIIEYYETSGFLTKGTEVVDRALEQHPFSVYFLVKKAQFALDESNLEDAEAYIERAKILDPAELEIFMLEARICVAKGRFNQAILILEDVLESVPSMEKTEILLEIADLFELWGKPQKEFESVIRALEIEPTNTEILERVSICVEEQQAFAQSITLHQAIVDEYPFCCHAWHNLGLAYMGLDLYEKGYEAFGYATAIQEDFEPSVRESGEAQYELGNYKAALEHYLEALHLTASPNEELYYSIGYSHFHLKNYGKALFYFEKAIKVDESYEDVYYMVGEVYKAQGDYQKALIFYKKALKFREDNVEFIQAIAGVHFDLENYEKAIEHWFNALEIEPENKALWTQLTYCYFSLGYFDEAFEVLQKAIELAGSQPSFFYQVFLTLYKKGKHQAAVESIVQALQVDYTGHSLIFEWAPELSEDHNVMMLIEQFKPTE